jgi:hypothetical protein
MSLKHIDLTNRRIYQDAREVRTKNAKTIVSTFFPVGPDIEMIVENWVDSSVIDFGEQIILCFPQPRSP